jgi:hypothetical protein
MSSTWLFWTNEEDAIICKFVAEHGPRSALCERAGVLPGRKAGGINYRMHFLNIIPNPRKPHQWVKGIGGDIWLLRLLSGTLNMGARRIHEGKWLPADLTLPAIKAKMREETLGDPKAIERARNASRLTPKKEAELSAFLLGAGRYACTVEVTELYKVTRHNVLALRKKLGVPLTTKEAYNSEPARRCLANKREAFYRGVADYRKNFRERRRKELLRQYRKLMRAGCKAQTKQCGICKQTWFATLKFFYKGKLHADGTQGLYSACRACGLPWTKKTKRRKNKNKH